MTVVGVVLAAGTATRFGGAKLLADIDGRPVLQHVLDRLRVAGIEQLVAVLGDAADEIERAMRWPAGTRRVHNPRPADGLASSLRIGVAAARRGGEPDAILVALGDQPRIRPDVIRSLLAAPGTAPVVVPRYADESNPNPVLVRRAAFAIVDEASGDRGLGPVLRTHPDLVQEIPVEGDNPDIDLPADLERIRASRSRVP